MSLDICPIIWYKAIQLHGWRVRMLGGANSKFSPKKRILLRNLFFKGESDEKINGFNFGSLPDLLYRECSYGFALDF